MASDPVKKKDPFGFADPKIEKMMTKHGWNRGVGLGASQMGDAEFGIVVKRKYTKTGLGDDPGKEFQNQWWHKAYDNASKNIGNKCPTDGVKAMERPLQFRAPKLKNGALFVPVQFVKRETLSCDDFVEEMKPASPTPSKDEEVGKSDVDNGGIPSFEDMFDACNGLTIHKGARSGITHKGKLQRLQEQEARMMKALMGEKNIDEEKAVDDSEPTQETKVDPVGKKSKKKKKKEQKTEESLPPMEIVATISEKQDKKGKKRKIEGEGETKKKKKMVENSQQKEVETTKIIKKKKKVISLTTEEKEAVISTSTKKKKKKVVEEIQEKEVESTKPIKKKKKVSAKTSEEKEAVKSTSTQKKKKNVVEEIHENGIESVPHKKKKKVVEETHENEIESVPQKKKKKKVIKETHETESVVQKKKKSTEKSQKDDIQLSKDKKKKKKKSTKKDS